MIDVRLDSWLEAASERLRLSGVSAAKLEARVIAGHVLGVDRSFVLTHPDHQLNPAELDALVSRRESGEPLAYILGYREFFGRNFEVNPSVLIPRQDTECLIEAVLALPQDRNTLLDVGTGSGCIAVTLGLERPNWNITATDVSPGALQVAQHNAQKLGASVRFLKSNMFQALGAAKFDMIVSNPPYIDRIFPLDAEVKDFEPSIALFGGADGLDFYRKFAAETKQYLSATGCLALEIGFDQGRSVPNILSKHGWTAEVLKDLSGSDRVVLAYPVPNQG